MKNLVEKFKALDKRVQIGAGIGAAIVVILVIALVIAMNGNPDNNGDTQKGTESEFLTEENGSEVLGDENVGTEEIGTEEVQGTEEIQQTETEMNTDSESNANVNTDTGVKDSEVESENNQSGTTAPDSEEEDILGQGTKDNPYLETPDSDNMTVKTVEIAAGKTVHYGIYRVSGMYLTIENANAYVIYDGKTYNSSNGKVSFKVETDAVASDAIYFEIGNKGSAPAAFTLKFTNPTGTQMNPTKIDNVTKSGNTFDLSLADGNTTGYYYKYKAQTTGTIKFYISSFSSKVSSAEALMSVTNNNTSQQKTFSEDEVLVDANGNKYILMDVTAGDEVIINISTTGAGRVKYPAADIKWVAQYQ